MKMTSKQFLALVSTTLLTIGALSIAIRTFSFKDREFKYRPFFRNKTEYDVLFFGTSHVINGVFPMQLWHDWGITSYNFGEHGTPIPTSYWVMRNAVRYHKPKIAVLDTYEVSSPKFDKRGFRFFLDIFPMTPTKLLAIRDLTDSKNYEKFLTNYEIYHNRWKEMSISDRFDSLFHSDYTKTKGAREITSNEISIAVPNTYEQTNELFDQSTIAMNYIRKFVDFCNKNDIIPILINIPYPANEIEQKKANAVTLLAQELGVPYYNMLRMNIVDYDTDCNDSNHLNPSGAYKVTDFLGHMLNRYGVGGDFDHRSDFFYKSWHNDYAEYKKSKLVVTENFKNSLMLLNCNKDTYSLRLFLPEGTELDRVEQKLVAQLGENIAVEYVPASSGTARRRGILHDIENNFDTELVWQK